MPEIRVRPNLLNCHSSISIRYYAVGFLHFFSLPLSLFLSLSLYMFLSFIFLSIFSSFLPPSPSLPFLLASFLSLFSFFLPPSLSPFLLSFSPSLLCTLGEFLGLQQNWEKCTEIPQISPVLMPAWPPTLSTSTSTGGYIFLPRMNLWLHIITQSS